MWGLHVYTYIIFVVWGLNIWGSLFENSKSTVYILSIGNIIEDWPLSVHFQYRYLEKYP